MGMLWTHLKYDVSSPSGSEIILAPQWRVFCTWTSENRVLYFAHVCVVDFVAICLLST